MRKPSPFSLAHLRRDPILRRVVSSYHVATPIDELVSQVLARIDPVIKATASPQNLENLRLVIEEIHQRNYRMYCRVMTGRHGSHREAV